MRSRARLTITLARDVLQRVDRLIDQQTLRNRSQAIEYLLRQSLQPRVSTAVLLAGGRARPEPHPALLPFQGQPLISLALSHLVGFGIQRVFILADSHDDALRETVRQMRFPGATIDIRTEPQPNGTAGAIKQIESELAQDTFLVLHADVLTDIDLDDLARFHFEERTLATIAVKPRAAERTYGKVMLHGNRITEFTEAAASQGISIVNTGVYMLQPEVLNLIEPGVPARFESDVFPRLAALQELSAFFFQGIWFDVSKPEAYAQAQTRWANRG